MVNVDANPNPTEQMADNNNEAWHNIWRENEGCLENMPIRFHLENTRHFYEDSYRQRTAFP